MLSQMLMELEVEQQIGAAKHERKKGRSTYRNGYRERTWQTRVGDGDTQTAQGQLLPQFA